MLAFWKLQPHLRVACFQQQRCISTSARSLPQTTSTAKQHAPFPFSQLSYHWNTEQPTSPQLAHADRFFTKTTPKFIWSAEKFKTIDFGSAPEICFLGRSNVGKSSLMNALLGKKIAHTSSKPGRTKLMNAFGVGGQDEFGKHRMIVLDMPGYGKGGRAEWGKEIMKYLEKRKELKRAFLLLEAEHGIKETDRQILALFQEHSIPFQIVLAKADKILLPGSRYPSQQALDGRFANLREYMDAVREVLSDLELEQTEVGEVLACSSEKRVEGRLLGIDAVRFAMLSAVGLESKDRSSLPAAVEVVAFEDLVYTTDTSPA